MRAAAEHVVRSSLVRVTQIEPRANDAAAGAMHERCAVARPDLVDDADVGEAAPRGRVAEEDQVAGMGTRAQRAAGAGEPVDVGDAVFAGPRRKRGEIDAVAAVDGAGKAGAARPHGGQAGKLAPATVRWLRGYALFPYALRCTLPFESSL